MPFQSLEASLKRLGLSDKEAAVYLAMLSLGPASVLTISRKSSVARATTYLMLEQLMQAGLVSVFERAGSQYYVAEGPEHLRYLIERHRDALNKEEKLLDDILPKLEAFTWSEDKRPTVRYYHGKEGLQALRSEMLRTSSPGDTWRNITPMDHLQKVFGEENYTYDRPRLASKIKSKTLFTTKSPERKKKLLNADDKQKIKRKFVKPEEFTSGTGITITKNRVAVGTMEDKISGFIVESESVAKAMRELFDLAWKRQD